MTENLEPWQECWREVIAPRLRDAELEALAEGLRSNDAALVQRVIAAPSGKIPHWDEARAAAPCTRACAIGYALWKGRRLRTVGQVDEAYHHLTDNAADSWLSFLLWFDSTDREVVREQLLPEVELILSQRLTT